VKQEMQKFMFNMNVPTRVGFQSPFTNITMDLTVPGYMSEEPAIIGGELTDNNYNEYSDEMDMMNHAFAEIMNGGDAKGRPFTFPIPTYNITKDFNWENDGLEPLWEMTAKYGIPYFSNFINSDMKPDDARSMCCRLKLDNRELRKRGGGLFGANPKTGSIGVVTLNMPRIGYLAKDDNDFFERLDRLMVLAKQSLEIKRELIENLTASGLHPYSRFYLSDVNKVFGEYWKNHFSTIGLIGMNDALLNFMNKSIADKEGKAFAEKVLDHMRNRIANFQKKQEISSTLKRHLGKGLATGWRGSTKKNILRYGPSTKRSIPRIEAGTSNLTTRTPRNYRLASPPMCSKPLICRIPCRPNTLAAQYCISSLARRNHHRLRRRTLSERLLRTTRSRIIRSLRRSASALTMGTSLVSISSAQSVRRHKRPRNVKSTPVSLGLSGR
jgi:hypothetical protein